MSVHKLGSMEYRPHEQTIKNLSLASVSGVVLTVIGLIFVPERIWPNILLASYYFIGLPLAGGVYIAFQYITNAGWGIAIRRIPEAMSSLFPYGAVLMLIVMAGIPVLYEWSHADVVASDHLLSSKTAWLNIPFFVARTVFYLVLWGWLLRKIVATSRLQDSTGEMRLTAVNKRYSAVYIVTFALSFTLASMDWIMSLEPHWYSTIFGIYNFCGVFLNGLAVLTALLIAVKRRGYLQDVLTEKHFLNLGKLIFAFSTFWMYIWFSQYLLIWYANIPEEVGYFLHRQEGSWVIFSVVNVVFNWFIPFVVLLPRWTKKNEGLLLKVCIIIMIGHWIDLFWMILPPFMKEAPVLNVWEIGPLLAVIPFFFILFFRSLAKRNLVPLKDPMLIESLPHH